MRKGTHLLYDGYGCNRAHLSDLQRISDSLPAVTKLIGLKRLSDNLIYVVDDKMIKKDDTGITGGIIFMESHFTFHAFPERGYFSADIYSCKGFDAEKVISYLDSLYKPTEAKHQIILRGEDLPLLPSDIEDELESKTWTFAKTMPKNPHYWSVKKDWKDDKAFESAVSYIYKNGVKEKYGGWTYTVLYLNGWRYWTMNEPVSKTNLINRGKA